MRDLALARLEGEKERGGEVQVGHFWLIFFGDKLVIFCQNISGEMILPALCP